MKKLSFEDMFFSVLVGAKPTAFIICVLALMLHSNPESFITSNIYTIGASSLVLGGVFAYIYWRYFADK